MRCEKGSGRSDPEDIDFDAANGMGTFTVNQFHAAGCRRTHWHRWTRAAILRIFPDKLEGSKTSLILKDTKTEASCRTIFMTAALAGGAEAVGWNG